MYNQKTGRRVVVDSTGNLTEVPVLKDGEGKPIAGPLKAGWRDALDADVAKVAAANKARDAKEAADAIKAEAKARADQDAKDKAVAAVGGVLR